MRWIISIFLFIFVAWIMPGVTIEGFWVAVLASLALGVIQFVFKFIYFLLLPLTTVVGIATFGTVFLFFNAVCIQITSNWVGGFEVVNFWYALLFGTVYSILYLAILKDNSK